MIKKIPTDGIRKKSKSPGSKFSPTEDFSSEPPEELLPLPVQDAIQDSADALERFMRRKSASREDPAPAVSDEETIVSDNSRTFPGGIESGGKDWELAAASPPLAPSEPVPSLMGQAPLEQTLTGQDRRILRKVLDKSKEGVESVSSPEGEILIIEPPFESKIDESAGVKARWSMRAQVEWILNLRRLFRKKDQQNDFIRSPRKILSVRNGVISGLGVVIIIFILLSTVFARATVFITPRVEQINIRDVTALFDASIVKPLPEKKVIPAERLEFTRNVSKEFETTGKELVEERARGKVKIYNRFSSSPQGLIANTRFVTDAGILYRLTSPVMIPGAKIENGSIAPQFIEAELIADQVGTEANLQGEIRLNIPGFKGSPKYDGFYGITAQGFSGGFRGEARVVSKDDLSAAEKEVTKQVFDGLREEMKRKVPPEFNFIETLSEIEITNVVSPRVRTRTERFGVEASARGRALIFRERDVRDMLRFLIIGGESSKKLVDESEELNYRIRSGDLKSGRAEVTVAGKVKVEDIIPRDLLTEELRGKKEGTIAEILKSRSDIAGFRISIFPPWRASASNDAGKIKLVVNGQ